jgi:VCBS repeat-containing protein
MRSMTFLVNDRSTGSGPTPAVAVTVTENADGTLGISLNVVGGVTGDLRGFFFDVASESRIGTLSVTPTSPGFTEFRQGNDSVRDLGNGANMNGLLGSDGGFDAGVEIGQAGSGHGDDYQSFSFTLKSSAGALTLDDFANADFGVRLTSVGRDSFCGDRDRDGEAKLLETVGRAMDAKDDTGALTEDAPVSQVTGNVFSNDLYLKPLHLITAVNGSAANIGDEIDGIYGTFRLHLDGSYSYQLDNSRAATQALAAGQQVVESFTYTAKNLDELVSVSTDTASVRITITGADDNNAPVITAAIAAGAVTELADNAPGESVQLHSASGTVDFGDVNLADSHTVSVAAAAAGFLGTLNASVTNPSTGDGAGQVTWDFSVSDGAIEHLGAGETLTQSYSLTIDDGHGGVATQLVTITLTGANDAPVIAGAAAAAAVSEIADHAPGEGTQVHSTGDSFNFTDLDLSDTHSVSVTPGDAGYLGTLSAAVGDDSTGDGTGQVGWSFQVSDGDIEHLGAGASVTQTYSVNVDDGHGGTSSQDVSVTITGANDAPEIVEADATGQVFEDGSRRDSGQLLAQDVDQNSTLNWTVDGPAVVATPDYRFLIDNLLIVRNGTTYFNDDFGAGGPPPQAPNLFGTATTISYATQGGFIESGGRAILDGALSVPGNSLGLPIPVHNNSALLLTDTSPNLALGLKIDDSFTVEGLFDLVLPDEELESFGVRLIDFNGSDTVDVRLRRDEDGVLRVVMREVDVPTNTITILDSVALEPLAGENQIVLRLTHNAATPGVIDASFDLIGAGLARHFDFAPGALGRIFGSGTPGDTTDDELFTRAQVVATAPSDLQNGVYGTLRVNDDGEWSYALDNASPLVQQLAQGEHVTDTFTVRVTDEHGAFDTQTVTIDVAGSNDAPLIDNLNSIAFGNVQEDFNPIATGRIVASDVDHAAALSWTVGPGTLLPVPGVPNAFTAIGYRGDYHFTLDQLTVLKNGAIAFDDTYSDGVPPPSVPAPGFAGSYVNGGAFTESGGRLHFDGSLANISRGIDNPGLLAGNFTLLATNIDPFDTTRGLKSDDDFTVEARYDLVLPGAGQAYGITLTDNSANATPPDQGGDSNISLLVRRDAGGNLIVQLNDFNIVADVATTQQELSLAPLPDETQIVLRVIHDADNRGVLHAEFDLVGPGGTRTFVFSGTAHIFGSATPDYAGDDENWLRVQLAAFGPENNANTHSLAGTYGSLSVQQDGQWTYALDPVASQALAQGQVFQESFAVRVTDEHGLSGFRFVPVNVVGSNDAVVTTGGATSGEVAEDGDLSASGNVTFTDPDLIDVHSATFSFVGSSLGTFSPLGSFSLDPISELATTADGSVGWTYLLDNSLAQFLSAGQTVTETYQVTIQEPGFAFGASQLVTITIVGAADAAPNTPPVANPDANDGDAVHEAGFTFPWESPSADPFASGNVLANDFDPDALPGLRVSVINGSAVGALGTNVGGTYGSLQMQADGSWVYTLNDLDADTDSLPQGTSVTDHFTYTVTDAQGASASTTLSIAISGANDAPVVTGGTTTGALVEDTVHAAFGDITFLDVDLVDIHFAGYEPSPSNTTGLGFLDVFTVNESPDSAEGSISWSYTLFPSTTLDALAEGQVVSETYTVTVVDEWGVSAAATQDVTITITGSNDGPVANDDSFGGSGPAHAGTLRVAVISTPLGDFAATAAQLNDSSAFALSADAIVMTQHFTAEEWASTLAQYDVVVVGGSGAGSDPFYFQDSHLFPALRDFVDAGGGVVSAGYFSAILDVMLHWYGMSSVGDVDYVSPVTPEGMTALGPTGVVEVFDPSHPITQGISSYQFGSFNHEETVSIDAGAIRLAAGVHPDYDHTAIAYDHVGDGLTAYVGALYMANPAGPVTNAPSHFGVEDLLLERAVAWVGRVIGTEPATDEDHALTISGATLLANDTDVDAGDAVSILSVSGESELGATVSLDAFGNVVYDPTLALQYLSDGQVVTDTFTYTIVDSHGATDTATVSVTVGGHDDGTANTPPVANPDSNAGDPVAEAGAGQPNDPFAAGNVLANDIDPDLDPGLHVTALNGQAGATFVAGTYGSLFMTGDGMWNYTLDDADPDTNALARGEAALDQFTYTVSDAQGASAMTTLTVAVSGANDIPTIVLGSALSGSVAKGGNATTSGQLIGADPDHGAQLHSFVTGNTGVVAENYHFAIDEFTVTRTIGTAPTVVVLNDTFVDGAPPPSSPPYSNGVAVGYGVRGAFTENGALGLAFLDGALAQSTFNYGAPEVMAINSALALTTFTGTDPNAGLRITHAFDATARFEAIEPGAAGHAYGIAFTDQNTGFGGDDNIQLIVWCCAKRTRSAIRSPRSTASPSATLAASTRSYCAWHTTRRSPASWKARSS